MRISAFDFRIKPNILGWILVRRRSHLELVNDDEAASGYIVDEAPNPSEKAEVLVSVGNSQHVIPFLCCWTDEGWSWPAQGVIWHSM